jgi:hypothetical protein
MFQGVFGQRMRFYNLVNHRPIQEDIHEEVEEKTASTSFFHPIHGDYQELETVTKSFIAQTSRNKHWSMSESTFLNQIAFAGTASFSLRYFTKRKKMKYPQKHVNRVVFKNSTKYGIVEVFAFSIPLIKESKPFYYNRKLGKDEVNLFKGRSINEDEDETPLDYYTEEELMLCIEKKMRSRGIVNKLRSSGYFSCGVSIIPEHRTFHRKKIPIARVFICLGAKRMQLIQKRYGRKLERE